MAKDLFANDEDANSEPRDLFAENGISPEAPQQQQEAPEEQNLLQKAGGLAQKYINAPMQDLMRQGDEMASGAFQGVANIGPGIANLGIKGVNAVTGNTTPEYKGFHFAPHTANAMAGELGSYFVPGGTLSLAGKIPKVAEGINAFRNIPQVANVTQKAKNAITRVPGLETILNALGHTAGGAFQGAVYNPENQGMGAAFGGAGNALGQAVGKAFPFAMNKLGFGPKPGTETLQHLNYEELKPTIEAAQRQGIQLRPGEAAESGYIGGQEGRYLRTSKGAIEGERLSKDRLKSEKALVNKLLKTTFNPKVGKKEINALYDIADTKNLDQAVVNQLKTDPLIANAFKEVSSNPAWTRKLGDTPENNVAYLDKVKRALYDKEKGLKVNAPGEANEYKQARDILVKKIDDLVPEYQKARQLSELKQARSFIKKQMREEEVGLSGFFNKLIKNDTTYKNLEFKLRNNPAATAILKDIKLISKDIINPQKAGQGAYQSASSTNQARGSLEKAIQLYDQLFNKERNYEAVKFTRDMDAWVKELQNAKQTGNKKEIDKALSSIFGKAFAEATPSG